MRGYNKGVIDYTRWLLNRMGAPHNANILWLCMCLNSIEFYYIIPDDSNRAADALDVRDNYISDGFDLEFSEVPTVMEVLVGMADRSTVMDYDSAWKWFVLFVKNLGLDYLTDENWTPNAERFVKGTIRKWLDRNFSESGVGSPFRSNGTYDVTKTSMWDSLQWYLSNEYGEGHL